MSLDQAGFDLRCDWGLQGLEHLSPAGDAVIVIDVLSFSTVVDIAVARGALVLPYRWKDDTAALFARENHALLAAGKRSLDRYSLSPASVLSIPAGASLVLPSPNGSTLCHAAAGVPTYTACLRNAPAVAAVVSRIAARIAVIPAGERWEDGTLRPALEDWLGAGAVLSSLKGSRSPEAELAVAAFRHFLHDLPGALSRCGSGKELLDRGFAGDLSLASAHNISTAVPILCGGRFMDASSPSA